MARQKGLLKIDGTIGGMTFLRTKDGLIVKEQLPSTKSKFESDPKFQRTRENAQEFGMAGTSGKMLRDAIRSFMKNASDSKVTARLTQVMSFILKEDKTSARGSRNVATGIKTDKGKAFLRKFNFNIDALLGTILFKPLVLDPATGEITIDDLSPLNEIEGPQGATHVTLKSAFLSIDFATGKADVQYSLPVNLELTADRGILQLSPTKAPIITTDTTVMHLLALEFYQEINNVQYSLKNGAYNCLEIVHVE
ncbi:hypothetical protein [Cytophaga hutchinsonii]|uniref:Uncharacterized protein n=1 Tax=Cytophaga hutchinsonii (strain ATCC 33406 / DSM 1761 / CIP 103989 / NBRC 15051 / NCIMB 9469 / D465) TaxID=269798 RepID=A0A6N4SQ71_CYTH3|nr:hypothetical protein [Cytophaga hutchinsonii]ABG58464.1 hypothetical protein CHU_1189 [Cytophaga hutchinsonii ATCC 33406]SFX74978.1 hypothetical protein SAMN04487930_10930 [Cytophaga hutchinsonii ATCC 33406]